MDEGQMGCIDALAAGVKTIVTRQGYHLNMLEGISHIYETENELISILKKIENDSLKKINVVKYWTWPFYAEKHLELWKHLIAVKENRKSIIQPKSYTDGIFSIDDTPNSKLNIINKVKIYTSFKIKSYLQLCHIYRDLVIKSIKKNGLFYTLKRICNFLFTKMKN